MVSARVDTGSIEAAGRAVGAAGVRGAADVALVAAAFGQVAGGVLDTGLASAAGGAGRQWCAAVLACTEAVAAVGGGLAVAGRSYDTAESTAAASFSSRP